jgi:1,4-alpha-glucan branching enzyme
MKPVAIALLLFASLCCTRECYAQDAGDFHPATTNVWGAEYPRVDSAGRAQIRVKAPDATKVKVNFWSGPKVDMEKQSDGYWMVTTPPLVPGLHYYTVLIDGAEVSEYVHTR